MALLCQTSPMLADTTYSGVLLGSLCDQRAKGLFCDVTIVVEDIKFRAHRNVLAASSGYFRNALASPDVWTSGQVLELMDLRSEVFARILNFIYSSKVALTSVEDVRSLVAAGKRLGIPFLERLSVSETRTAENVPQNQACLSNRTPLAPGSYRGRRKMSEKNNRRGPRITNAFSITDIATGNDPFTPLDLRGDGHRSMANIAANCPAPDFTPSTSESLHTLADHSYAVSLGEGGEASAHLLTPQHTTMQTQMSANTHLPVQTTSTGQVSQTCSPLKKRHKLWGSLDEHTPSSPCTPAQTTVQTPGGTCSVPALPSPSPDSSSPNPNTQWTPASDLTKTAKTSLAVSEPPSEPLPLKPSGVVQHREPGSSTTPTHRHRSRVLGLLFCRYCHRKFMHLKRLRNHEQVCTKGPNDGEEGKDAAATNSTFISGPTFTALPSGLTGPPAADLPEMGWEVGAGGGLGVGLGVGNRVGRCPRRMYPCSVCKRAYATISSLRRHENVHSWQRAYPCHYCNKVFALAEYRTKHEVWHTGERRYQCIFCLETFMTYYILKNHQKSYHGIDPRLSVNRKSANGGFKGSVYPIKLYRLLPMKFRKRRYRTYGRAFPEAPELGGQAFPDPLGSCSSPSAAFGEGTDGPPIFSAPLTFMATPRMVAPVQPSRAEAEACLRRGAISPPPLLFHGQSGSTDSHNYTLPELQMQPVTMSSPVIHDKELGDGQLPPDSTSGSGNDLEDCSSNVAHPPEDRGRITAGGKILTYIAKPACPGPSSDSRVPPLCQITVKIGNEAIVRRSIAGSNLIPRKKRHHSATQMERGDGGGGSLVEQARKTLSLHPELGKTQTSFGEAEVCDDSNFCDDMDEPWRPYYSYKSKKKAKRQKSRERRGGRRAWLRRSTDRESSLQGEAHSPEQNLSSEAANTWIRVQRTKYKCENCQSTFSSPSTLQKHMADCHPKEQVHTCRTCGKQCPQEQVPQDGRDFTCSTCTRDGPHLENSAGSHSSDRRYRCSFCPQRFLYLATRRSHERKHQEKHGKGQGCQNIPKLLSLGVHQKRQSIKTEEEEIEVQQGGMAESKPSAREELKQNMWDDPKLDAPITFKLEDQTETNSSDCDMGSTRKPDTVMLGSPQEKA